MIRKRKDVTFGLRGAIGLIIALAIGRLAMDTPLGVIIIPASLILAALLGLFYLIYWYYKIKSRVEPKKVLQNLRSKKKQFEKDMSELHTKQEWEAFMRNWFQKRGWPYKTRGRAETEIKRRKPEFKRIWGM